MTKEEIEKEATQVYPIYKLIRDGVMQYDSNWKSRQAYIAGRSKTIDELKLRDLKITLLEKYSEFLEANGYTDTDWRTEEPFAIDEFLKMNS